MNKIYRIIWNSALNAWVVVSELTRNHTKRASATVTTAVLATLLSAAAQASTTESEYDPNNDEFTLENPSFEDKLSAEDNYKFGLVVVGKDKKVKTQFGETDEAQGKVTISVEATESSESRPKYKSSYLYLRENGGIEIDQEGRSAKFKVKHGDGLKIDDTTDKLVADTVELKVENGKVSTPNTDDNKKLVNAGNLATELNKLGWQLKTTNGAAAAGNGTTSTVKSGDEVEFKGEGVEVTTTSTGTKHTVTIKAAQSTNKGGAWKITAAKEDGGELDPANTAPTEQEVNTNDKVTLKAGDNLKIKQSGKDFTYSLKKELKNLTSVEFKDANGSTDSASTKIDKDGLTITPTNGAATGTTTPNAISVTTSGISAGSKEITNVKSALSKYNSSNNDAKKDLVDLSSLTNTATGGTTTNNGLANKAATVGDLAGLGWVLSSTKTTDEAADKPFHAAVKNANEVEFKGKGAATVSAKTDSNGKHTVTVDVKEVEAGNGLEKDTANGKIKLKVKAKDGEENLLTVGADGVSVTKGEFNTVETTTTTGHGGNANDRGKVTVKASANGGQATADDKKKVATVGDVADAINDAATFVKVESTTDDIEDGTANGNTADDQALKAGDTLTFKAGKNLKAKLDGKSVTFALAKNITTDSATLSEKLSIGKGADKVDITSDDKGLNFAKTTAVNGDKSVYLNGIASTLTDTLAGSPSSHITAGDQSTHYTRAASVKDVLNAGWNIKGVKSNSATKQSENVDFVRTYDTVEFLSGSEETTTVTVDSEDNGKTTKVKIGAKTSVIKEHNGKLLTGKQLKEANTGTATNTAEDADEGKGLVTAEAVINAVNKAGWRIKTTAANGQAGQTDKFETVTSGTNVTFDDGKGTTATVTKNGTDGITVKYEAKVGDGLKIGDGDKIVADTTTLTVNGAAANGAVDNTTPKGKIKEITSDDEKKKLVKAGDLVTALNSLSWTATAGKDADGELDGNASEQEVKAGDKVTFKAGKNLKVKQDNANFTYSLKDSLTGLKDIELSTPQNGANGASTKITNEGLTITLANGTYGRHKCV